MCRVRGVVSAALLAVFSLVGMDSALADPSAPEGHFDRFLLFSGFDLWRNGGAAHGGLLWSPGGIAREGFTLKLLVAAGQYQYISAGATVTGRYTLASPMAGWRFKGDRFELSLFAGPDFQSHRLTPQDLGNRLRGDQTGLRVGGDLWYQPYDMFMATASISASTIGANYWSRAAIGWHLFKWAWLGPEVLALGGGRYHQVRAGVHVTALQTSAFEWSAGLGYAHDSDHRGGAYARLGLITRR